MNNKGFMKTVICILTTILFTIILLALILAGYIWYKNPMGIRDMFFSNQEAQVDENFDHPLLSDDQEQTLKQIGIDPSKLPTEITPEMQKCFTEKLGETRVKEIMESGTPSPADFLKAGSCL